jgi:hypothetical protein
MADFNFNLRKKSSKTETPVNLIIRFNKNKLTYSTFEKINPKFWQDDPAKRRYQRALETKAFPEFPEFNLRLDKIEALAKTVFRQYLNDNDNQLPTTQELKKLLDIKLKRVEINKPQERKDTFCEFCEKFIEESKNKVNSKTSRKFSPYTILGYKNALKTIRDFSQKYGVHVDFETIDTHTGYSDGNKDSATSLMSTPLQDFNYAKQSAHIDFYGISEHNHLLAGMKSPGDYHQGILDADAVNNDGSFVAMYGMEYGVISNGGHVIIYGFDSLIGWDANDYDIYNAEYNYTTLWQTVNAKAGAFAYLAHPQTTDYDSIFYKPLRQAADSAIVGMAARSGPAFSTAKYRVEYKNGRPVPIPIQDFNIEYSEERMGYIAKINLPTTDLPNLDAIVKETVRRKGCFVSNQSVLI